MITSEKIAEIDLPGILEGEGIQLRRTGKNWQFCCPFHDDMHPSAGLYRKGGQWRWHCFGCQAGGDAVEFIQKLHGLGFKSTCRFFGIELRQLSRADREKIRKNKARRKIADAFQDVELEMIGDLGSMVRMIYRITARWKTEDDMEQGAEWLHVLADLEAQLQTMMTGPLADRVGFYLRWVNP